MTPNRPTRRISLYVRSFEPYRDEHEAVVERIERMKADGDVDDVEIRTWPNKVRLSERTICRDVVELYETFRDWAAANDVDIHPPFTLHETGFELLDDDDEVLVFPVMCLTVTEDDELVGIYPCRIGDESYTVGACLDALERGGALPGKVRA